MQTFKEFIVKNHSGFAFLESENASPESTVIIKTQEMKGINFQGSFSKTVIRNNLIKLFRKYFRNDEARSMIAKFDEKWIDLLTSGKSNIEEFHRQLDELKKKLPAVKD